MKKLTLALSLLLPSPLLALSGKAVSFSRHDLAGVFQYAHVHYIASHAGYDRPFTIVVRASEIGEAPTDAQIKAKADPRFKAEAQAWSDSIDNPEPVPVKKVEVKDRAVTF